MAGGGMAAARRAGDVRDRSVVEVEVEGLELRELPERGSEGLRRSAAGRAGGWGLGAGARAPRRGAAVGEEGWGEGAWRAAFLSSSSS